MILRCPRCGREGTVPERLGRLAHRVRCRPCGARFSTGPAPGNGELRAPGAVETGAGDPLVRDGASLSDDGFSGGSDPDLATSAPRSPFDSQYEMTAELGGELDDSQVELPAFTSTAARSGDSDSGPAFETESSEFLLAVPWYFKFIESWGRLHFYVAVGFAASSLSVLGFLLIRALVAGQILSSSITALIVGCVATIAFLLLSLSATVLIILLVDLARNVRLLIQQNDRNPAGTIDTKNSSRTSLSQPVG
jgi:hypothetical protein